MFASMGARDIRKDAVGAIDFRLQRQLRSYGKDDPAPDEAAKTKLREQARVWLQAELIVWAKIVESGTPQAKSVVVPTLDHWKVDADLAGIRDEAALEKLPESEREGFRALWSEVEALRQKAEK